MVPRRKLLWSSLFHSRCRWLVVVGLWVATACTGGALETPEIDLSGLPADPPGGPCALTGVACPDFSIVGSEARAWVFADDPVAPRHTPAPQFQHNSSGGINRVLRRDDGAYTVEMPGILRAGGTVLVSAYGAPNWCNVERWVPGSNGQEVSVLCYSPGGAAADTRFTLLFYRERREGAGTRSNAGYLWWGGGVPGRQIGGPPRGFDWLPETAFPNPLFAWDAERDAQRVTSRAGTFRPQGVIVRPFRAEGPVWVTAYGSRGQYCTGFRLTSSASEVVCFPYRSSRDHPLTQAFTITELEDPTPGTLPGEETKGGWAVHGSEDTMGCYVPIRARNDGGLDPTLCRTAVGEYTVSFEGLASASSTTVLVSGNTPSHRCAVESWGDVAGSVDVSVGCTDPEGTHDDSSFTVLLLTDLPLVDNMEPGE